MTLYVLIESIGRYIGKLLSEHFTGQIVITINIHKGGIGNAEVTTKQALNKDA